jgi:hypothetical protein
MQITYTIEYEPHDVLTDVHVATCFSTIWNNSSQTFKVTQSNISDIRVIGKDTDVIPSQRINGMNGDMLETPVNVLH